MFRRIQSVFVSLALLLCHNHGLLRAQLTFKELPNYGKYQEVSSLRSDLGGGGRVEQVQWSEDGESVQFSVAGKRKSIDLKTFVVSDSTVPATATAPDGRRGQRSPRQPVGRAQQRSVAVSPDGKWRAVYADFNVILESTTPETEKIRVT
ncbi:MAG: hypothetical protein ABL921_09540, partial [Pirellula sp.]